MKSFILNKKNFALFFNSTNIKPVGGVSFITSERQNIGRKKQSLVV